MNPHWRASTSRAVAPLLLAAAVLRVLYAVHQSALEGDPIHYATVAAEVAAGDWAAIDPWWFSPFALVVAGFHWAIPIDWEGAVRAVSVATGLGIVALLWWAGRRAIGARPALMAAAIVACHPRMIESAAEGYPEALYILISVGAGFWILARETEAVAPGPSRALLGGITGLLLSAVFVLRPESAFLLLLGLITLRLFRPSQRDRGGIIDARYDGVMVLVGMACVSLYAGWLGARLPGPVLFGKGRAVYTQELENTPGRARETYSLDGLALGVIPKDKPKPVAGMISAYPRKLAELPRAAAYAAVHPLLPVLAALGAWVFWRARPGLVVFLAVLITVPALAYPLANIIPRYLYQTLPWLAVFGAVGTEFLLRRWRSRVLKGSLLAVVYVPLLVASVLLSQHHASRGAEYRRLAAWIDENLGATAIPESLVVVTQSPVLGFYSLSSHRRVLPWLDDDCQLAAWMSREGLEWIAVDRRYLSTMMPQYLPLLDRLRPTNFKRVAEFATSTNQVRLLRRNASARCS
jgi:hypothetical protein